MALIKDADKVSLSDVIKIQNTVCLNQMKRTAKNVFNLVWNNSSLSPQEVCDVLGVDAAKGFDAHAKLQELIYFIDSSWVPLVPPVAYVKNEDGTVTIGE